jgi:hypothetical protein
VRVQGDRALTELPFAIECRITSNGAGADLASYCRSQYRAQRTDRSWRIARITSSCERDTLTPEVPGNQVGIGPGDVIRYRPPTASWPGTRTGPPSTSGLTSSATTSPNPSPPVPGRSGLARRNPSPAMVAGARKEHRS